MSKEAMKLALARLQARTDTADLNAIAALNEALAEQPAQQQEPNEAIEGQRRLVEILAENWRVWPARKAVQQTSLGDVYCSAKGRDLMFGNHEIASDQDSAVVTKEMWSALREALTHPQQEPVAWLPSAEWTACVKLPVTVHVRQQRPGETHVSTREGITPVKPDDLIMRGVSGEEYPIGREIFERTYRIGEYHPTPETKQEPVGQLQEEAFGRGQVIWIQKPPDNSLLYTAPPAQQAPVAEVQQSPVAIILEHKVKVGKTSKFQTKRYIAPLNSGKLEMSPELNVGDYLFKAPTKNYKK